MFMHSEGQVKFIILTLDHAETLELIYKVHRRRLLCPFLLLMVSHCLKMMYGRQEDRGCS